MALTQQQTQTAQQAFNQADTQRKGSLTSSEFYKAIQILNLGYSFAEVFELYKGIDKNHDFEVDLKEFIHFMDVKGFRGVKVDLSNADNIKIAPGYRSSFRAEKVLDMLSQSNLSTSQVMSTPVQQTTVVQNQPTGIAQFDTERKGWLNRENLRAACRALRIRCNSEEHLDSMFEEINASRSGRISQEEFADLLKFLQTPEFRNKRY